MRPQLLFLGVAVLASGCDAPAPSTRAPAVVTIEEFRTLHWIAGRWRGTDSATGGHFYESYRVLDDSTLEAMSWADSSFTTSGDTTLQALRGGQVRRGSQYVAVGWDSTTIRFVPIGSGANSFVWTKESPDRWIAVVTWTDADGRSQDRGYVMTRVAGP